MSPFALSMRWRTIALFAALALAGCIQTQEDEPEVESPDESPRGDAMAPCTPPEVEETGASGGQSGVTNNPGSFTYGGQAAAKTATEVFLWENPSTSAQVTFGGQSGVGTLTITIQDHCGVEMFKREHGGASQQGGAVETTASGSAGTWILTFEFTLYTGQVGITINSA